MAETSPVTNISDLVNTPRDFTINGKKYSVKRLSMSEIISDFESLVLSNYNAETILIANGLPAEDRRWYVTERSQQKPKGQALYKDAMEATESFSGLFLLVKKGLNKLQKVSDDEISNIMMASQKEEVAFSALISFLLGYDINTVGEAKVSVDDKKK
jgi:hypothetical protein